MASVFNKKLPHSCTYCVYGKPSLSGEEILCKKMGVTSKFDQCRHYKYDPLKRQPKAEKISENYNPEDFSL